MIDFIKKFPFALGVCGILIAFSLVKMELSWTSVIGIICSLLIHYAQGFVPKEVEGVTQQDFVEVQKLLEKQQEKINQIAFAVNTRMRTMQK